jgi:crotonobetainyl-CoA:carnitine CoA-transferase CaiB-like acyl-CoA transferase
VPIRAFRAKDGKYLTIDAAQEKFFQGVCQALGIAEVGKDPRFSTRNARLKNRDALMPILERKFLEKDREEWLDLLIKADVPAGPVNNLAEALSDPSVLARNMVVSVNHLGEKIKMVGNPIKMSKVKEEVFEGAPTLGQHTGEILSALLGYSREQIEEWKKQKVL